jgi:hypothetical protein
VLGSKPAFGPAGLGREFHLNEIAQRLTGYAFFYHAFEAMVFANDPQRGVSREGAVGEDLGEPLSNLLQVAEHSWPPPAVGPSNEYKLGTQITADRF